jgi:DNA-binding LacI/PurR family transcriptional regulator
LAANANIRFYPKGRFLKRKSQVSLKQIADATNLSITTVSRVLRKKGEISEETRERVMKVATELNYRPNLLIQGIQTGITGNVGVMIPPCDYFWVEILKGVHDGLAERNFAPINLWDESEFAVADREGFMLRQMHRLIDRRVDGVILYPRVSEVYGSHLDELESWELPVVTIDHELEFSDSVATDERLGAKLVAEHLYQLGHRHIGHLTGDQRWTWAKLRRKYFEDNLSMLPGARCTTVIGFDEAEKIPAIARQMLTANPRPTAIFACGDWVALEIYRVASELNIRIPEELSIVGYSDSPYITQMVNPPLTTIRQRPRQIGLKTAEMIVDRIEKKDNQDKRNRFIMDCELIIRGSTGKP